MPFNAYRNFRITVNYFASEHQASLSDLIVVSAAKEAIKIYSKRTIG
jgi:hypothetical protein